MIANEMNKPGPKDMGKAKAATEMANKVGPAGPPRKTIKPNPNKANDLGPRPDAVMKFLKQYKGKSKPNPGGMMS